MANGSATGSSNVDGGASLVGGADTGPPFSPEAAERAAAAFVPLWQLDDAPFSARHENDGGNAELLALGAPVSNGIALNIAASLTLGAVEGAKPTPDSTDKMASTAPRQPLPRHPTAPSLPSIIVEGPVEAAEPETEVSGSSAPALAAVEPAAPATERVQAREPKTDPPGRPKRQRVVEADSTASYNVPRSRTPMLLAAAAIVSAALVIGVYFAASGSTPPAQPQQAAAISPQSAAPGAPTVPPRAPPPPLPPDDTPTATEVVSAQRPPTPAPPATSASNAPRQPVTAVPGAQTTQPAATQAPHVAVQPASTSRKAAKNPNPPATPGGIVRNNPF